MKRFILFALAYISSVLAAPFSLLAQDSESTFPNYVVIGAFAHEKNAIVFTEEAKRNKYTARFEMNPHRNLFYVYVLTTDDREYARVEALRLRTETKYFDAWVYSGAFGKIGIANLNSAVEQLDFNPVTGQRLENISTDEHQVQNAPTDSPPNQRQKNATGTRLVNSTGQPLQNAIERENQSNQQRASTRNQGPIHGSENGGDAAQQANRDGTMEQDGDVQPMNASTPLVSDKQKQSTVPGNRSGKQTHLDNKRNNESSVAPAQQGKAISQENSQQAVNADNTKLQRLTSDETTTTLEGQHAAKATDSRTQTAFIESENPLQEISSEEKADASTKSNKENVQDAVEDIPAPVRQSTAQLTSDEVVGKNFYFHLFRADNRKTIPGEVDAIDFEKSRKMGTYPANEGVKVTMAGGKMKHISFVCQVFGYRKLQQEFDPENLSELLYLDGQGNLVVPFELVRLQKGDIAIMYNVFFFKDAAVMRPESRYEVNNLLDLLEENPSYKIMIHGHTNGNASGKIIRMDKPGNFYSLSGTKQGFGSAKELSEERALVIRDFLISSGINAERMQVKAWGGKKPIHDKHSVRAQENVRVEIEILSE